MTTILPPRLRKGSHIRVVSPSRAGSILSDDIVLKACDTLNASGFCVSFADYWKSAHMPLNIGSVKERVADIHAAFLDDTVDGILTAIGGYNANQLLSSLDYELIAKHPKIICGFSDITVLLNAIYTKTKMVTYLGPHFSSWGMRYEFDYSENIFLRTTGDSLPYILDHRVAWSNDEWYLNQEERILNNDNGPLVVNTGEAKGIAIGGNSNAFSHLLGTEYMPPLEGAVLFLEQGDETNLAAFDAQLQSILDQPDADKLRGLVIGRFSATNSPSDDAIKSIVRAKPLLNRIPVVANVGFGHTTPIATIAIGGEYGIYISTSVLIEVITH